MSQPYGLVSLAAVTAVVSGIFYNRHLQTHPITGRRQFIMVTHGDLLALADAADQQLEAEYRGFFAHPNDPDLELLERVLARLRRNPVAQGVPWKVKLVRGVGDAATFALHNGCIYVFEDILDAVERKEDQIAFLLSHEMAHVVFLHVAEGASLRLLFDHAQTVLYGAISAFLFDSTVLAAAVAYVQEQATEVLTTRPFSRSNELEADEMALYMVAEACFDPAVAARIWSDVGKGAAEGSAVDVLSNHPSYGNRHQRLKEQLPDVLSASAPERCRDSTEAASFWRFFRGLSSVVGGTAERT